MVTWETFRNKGRDYIKIKKENRLAFGRFQNLESTSGDIPGHSEGNLQPRNLQSTERKGNGWKLGKSDKSSYCRQTLVPSLLYTYFLFLKFHTLQVYDMDLHENERLYGVIRRRQWHPTPVLLTGKSHGQRSLVGCSWWGREELDMTERLHFYFSLSCIGEGNGNPLQCSCLENPRDGGAWWAAVYGVAQSRTRLKRLSSSNSVVWLVGKWKLGYSWTMIRLKNP